MQLSAPTASRPVPSDLAQAVRTAADELGHRPLVTVLSERGREEQSAVSLAQWAAKGAHLLELELLVEPGDTIALSAPPSWPSVAVCLAAWWSGVCVDLDGAADVAVLHESVPAREDAEVLWLGDAVDGSPVGEVMGEPWVRAVQTFPDQPPPARAAADLPALRSGDRTWTQRELLQEAAGVAGGPATGTVGFEAWQVDGVGALIALAVRPLVAHRPTVVLHGVDRLTAAGEKIKAWLP